MPSGETSRSDVSTHARSWCTALRIHVPMWERYQSRGILCGGRGVRRSSLAKWLSKSVFSAPFGSIRWGVCSERIPFTVSLKMINQNKSRSCKARVPIYLPATVSRLENNSPEARKTPWRPLSFQPMPGCSRDLTHLGSPSPRIFGEFHETWRKCQNLSS